MQVKFNDLSRIHKLIKKDALNSFSKVIEKNDSAPSEQKNLIIAVCQSIQIHNK